MSDRKAIGGVFKMRIETLAAAFALFEQEGFTNLTAEERQEVRTVFYSGAQATMRIIEGIGADREKRAATARALIEELSRFAEEIGAKEQEGESDDN